VLNTVHVTAFSLGGVFSGHGVYTSVAPVSGQVNNNTG